MTNHSTSRGGRARRWATRAVGSALALTVLLPAAVGAAGNGALAVRGTQHAFGSCGGDGYLMTGDLEGCWWITDFQSTTPDSRHNVRATGTELFIGWIGTRYGSFTTTFQYTAKMDGPWATSPEIHGRCHHPVDSFSGTGDFAGISGELSFKDVVDVDPPYYPYWGSLRIAGQQLLAGARTTNAAPSTGTTTSAALSC